MSFCENQWVDLHFKNYTLQICLQSNMKVERKQFEAPALYFLSALVWY